MNNKIDGIYPLDKGWTVLQDLKTCKAYRSEFPENQFKTIRG